MPNLDNAELKMRIASLIGMPLSDLGRDIDAVAPKLLAVLRDEFESPQAAMMALAAFYIGMACRAVKEGSDLNPVEWCHELIDTMSMLMLVGTFDHEGTGQSDD